MSVNLLPRQYCFHHPS